MLPTVADDPHSSTPDRRRRSRRRVAPTREDALARLDEVLWRPRSIRLLDAHNRVVAGAWPRSPAAALDLIGHSQAVAVMGTLRAGVRAVDIDLADELSSIARNTLLDWAATGGHPTLVRPSGRPGHAHVLIAGLPARAEDDALDRFCAELRAELGGLPAAAIDPRPSGTLRTLTSPHRHGLACPPVAGDPRAFLAHIDHAPAPAGADRAPARGPHEHRRPRTAATDEPLVPRRRPYRPLPADLTDWMATGQCWPLGGHDHSRSTREAIVTAAMIRAGWTHEQAWTAILTAHPDTMTRARSSQPRWTRHVWNRAVEDNDAHDGDTQPLPPELIDDLAAARVRLDTAARTRLGPRARPAVLLVADAVLALMARRRARRVGVAQRLLHEDLDLACPTIGKALDWLDHAGVITLDRSTLDRRPGVRATTSYEAILPARTDEEIPPEIAGVWENLSPSRHTPTPSTGLPRGAHQVLRTLRAHTALPVPALAALLTQDQTPSPSELRTTTDTLRALADLDLVSVDADGTWTLTHALPPLAHRQVVAHARAQRDAAVAAERAAYRRSASSDWSLARAAAIKAQRAKERAWWASLTYDEQVERAADYAMRYAALPLAEQMQVRHALARRRAAAGIDQTAYATAWADSYTHDQWADRTAMRTAIHRTLPAPERAARVAAWEHHRTRWGLPRIRPTTPAGAESLFDGAAARDNAFLAEQLTLVHVAPDVQVRAAPA